MELKNGMTVISPKNVKRHNIKKGDEFIVKNVEKLERNIHGGYSFRIDIKTCEDAFCLLDNCCFIDNNDWIVKQ